jgi:cell division protein FtsI (penicillin-binding protein 3)
LVILDSPVTHGHEGGMVGAPLFQKIAQQVLEYLHVPRDVDIPKERQLLLASKSATEKEVAEGTPDRLGTPLDIPTDDQTAIAQAPPAAGATRQAETSVEPVAAVTAERIIPPPIPAASRPVEPTLAQIPPSGTVVLEVEQGGIVVPSFVGKPLRAAIETAQNSGIELDAIGDGVAREQSPPAGAHVPAGSRVEVRFQQ